MDTPPVLHGFDPTLLLILNLIGTFVFGLSGGLAAVRAHLDLFGVMVLAIVVGIAGGITRDVLIGIPPQTFRDWRYLAVAHFGRGRGDYEESEYPAHWGAAADAVTQDVRLRLKAIWEDGRGGEAAVVADRLAACLGECAARLLLGLYPEAGELLSAEASPAEP